MAHEILIAEDDQSLRIIYAAALKRIDADLIMARDGEEALAYLAERAPHLVILDMRLPVVPGEAVLDYIYHAPHLVNTRVLILTAHEDYRSLPLRPGDRFMLKPVINGALAAAVTEILAFNPTH
ncbi:MAG: response regulator [Candidatus Flexifilum sp.]|jgi:DNA-binding response OmpR family regulator